MEQSVDLMTAMINSAEGRMFRIDANKTELPVSKENDTPDLFEARIKNNLPCDLNRCQNIQIRTDGNEFFQARVIIDSSGMKYVLFAITEDEINLLYREGFREGRLVSDHIHKNDLRLRSDGQTFNDVETDALFWDAATAARRKLRAEK